MGRIRRVDRNQGELDAIYIYIELMNVMKSGLVQVRMKDKYKDQPWFTKKIAGQRHEAEVEWLKCIDPEERRRRREVYLKVRRAYAKEVKRAKGALEGTGSSQYVISYGCAITVLYIGRYILMLG